MPTRRFGVALAAITLCALAFRVGYVLVVTRYENSRLYDAFWYGATSLDLAHGHFFQEPLATTPTATHPPLTSFLLVPASYLFGLHTGTTPQRITMAILGALVVLLVGIVGARMAGPWVGLVAAVLAAFAPDFWMPSGILMSETPAMVCTALVFLAIVHLGRVRTLGAAALLGLACGATALARPELVLFVPFLAVPAALLVRQVPLGRRLALVVVAVLAAAVVMAPWIGRNLATFKDPTYLTSGDGLVLLGANCPAVYRGPGTGSWSLPCAVSLHVHGDESVVSNADQEAAIHYAEHHLGRLPAVVAARIGRTWSLYKPVQEAASEVNEGRPYEASLAGDAVFYLLIPLAVGGIVMLRRARIPQWFLLVPAGILTVVAAATYGLVRLRAPFEVGLVILAAPPLVWTGQRLGHWLWTQGSTGAHARGRSASGEPEPSITA